MGAVFISYRRGDAEGEAGRLFDDLSARFGADKVFMDVVGIEPGRDFRKVIEQKVSSCSVLLVVMGRGWLGATTEAGRRRLDDPADFVRLETAAALKRDIPVIPVFVRGGSVPNAAELPEDLKDLAYRNGVELTHTRWSSDVQLLLKALRSYVEDAEAGDAKSQHVAQNAPPLAQHAPLSRASGGSMETASAPTSAKPSRSLLAIAAAVTAIAVGGFGLYEYKQARVAEDTLAVAAKEEAARERAARETRLKEEAAKVGKEAAAKERPATRPSGEKESAQTQTAVASSVSLEHPTPERLNTAIRRPTVPDTSCPMSDHKEAESEAGTRVVYLTSSDPAAYSAEVWLDGKCASIVKKERADPDIYSSMLVNVSPGAHELKIVKKGFAEVRRQLKLAADKPPGERPKVVVKFSMRPQ